MLILTKSALRSAAQRLLSRAVPSCQIFTDEKKIKNQRSVVRKGSDLGWEGWVITSTLILNNGVSFCIKTWGVPYPSYHTRIGKKHKLFLYMLFSCCLHGAENNQFRVKLVLSKPISGKVGETSSISDYVCTIMIHTISIYTFQVGIKYLWLTTRIYCIAQGTIFSVL